MESEKALPLLNILLLIIIIKYSQFFPIVDNKVELTILVIIITPDVALTNYYNFAILIEIIMPLNYSLVKFPYTHFLKKYFSVKSSSRRLNITCRIVLKNFAKFTEKNLRCSSTKNKIPLLLFFCEFYKIFTNVCSSKHLRAAAYVNFFFLESEFFS